MSKIINITDRLSKEKPEIQLGEKMYKVQNGMSAVLKFEELALESTSESLIKAVELTIGKEAVDELQLMDWSLGDFKVLTTAILAAMQDITYDEAEARFHR